MLPAEWHAWRLDELGAAEAGRLPTIENGGENVWSEITNPKEIGSMFAAIPQLPSKVFESDSLLLRKALSQ